jgi:hypothetical protein
MPTNNAFPLALEYPLRVDSLELYGQVTDFKQPNLAPGQQKLNPAKPRSKVAPAYLRNLVYKACLVSQDLAFVIRSSGCSRLTGSNLASNRLAMKPLSRKAGLR